jgi:hypothetical protein
MPLEIEDLTADITRTTRTETGEVWLKTRFLYGFLGHTPCRSFALNGNIETFIGTGTEIIRSEDLGDGWIKYWVIDTDEGRTSEIRLAQLCKDFLD